MDKEKIKEALEILDGLNYSYVIPESWHRMDLEKAMKILKDALEVQDGGH